MSSAEDVKPTFEKLLLTVHPRACGECRAETAVLETKGKKLQEKVGEQEGETPREYLEGESHCLWERVTCSGSSNSNSRRVWS